MKNIRQIENQLKNHFDNHRQAIILLGPRQVGKTTIVKKIFPDAKYLLVDEEPIRNALEKYSSAVYKQIIGQSKQVIIDEIHLISDPGRVIKILYDQFSDLQIIVTGSSSLHIKNKTSESMAGRCIYYHLYPLTFSEYLVQMGIEDFVNSNILNRIINLEELAIEKIYDQGEILNQILLYGLYPEMVNQPKDKTYLKNLANTAIFKDIIELSLIDNRPKALDLLRALAHQVGNLISYSELSNILKIDAKTVQRYIEIFEQSFILFRVYPYFSNKRKEIGKAPKVFFYDLGIRNALVEDYSTISLRANNGALFENFIFSEIKKLLIYNNSEWKINYWRLKSGAEVDLVLNNNLRAIGCEIIISSGYISKAFLNNYPDAKTYLITSSNFY